MAHLNTGQFKSGRRTDNFLLDIVSLTKDEQISLIT